MKRALIVVFVLACAPRAGAHQLDEYLQATRLAVSRERVGVELDLTPGVSVAPEIFAMIDGDGDRRVDPEEIERYARRVLGDLELRVDDRPYPLELTRAECPPWDEIREGMGRIRIEAAAEILPLKRGRHRVAYENAHQSAGSVYLVNVLVPSSTTTVIRGQRRDVLQRSIRVDVEITPALDVAIWFGMACAGLMMFLGARLRRGAAEPFGSAAQAL